MGKPYELNVAEAAAQIGARRLSPVELMESLLSRATAKESSLRVWVTLNPNAALEAAQDCERRLMEGHHLGPLHGVPVGVKDIYYTKGVRTTACSPIYADFVPDYDATTVARLKKAGAIIMGKTVTTEFACGDPPPTRNPWNAAHTPGGSSSGSAVGVATRIFPAALGSQTGGSVLRPATYNGVVGLKPTFGRISKYGVMAVAWSLDTMGTFTRTVEDSALMLNVLAGHDPQDTSSSLRPVPDYRQALLPEPSPPRIGLVRRFFHEKSEVEVRRHTDAVVERFSQAGAEVEEAVLPDDFEAILAAHRVIMSVEAAAAHETTFRERPDDYSPNVCRSVEMGNLTPATTYLHAQRLRRRFRQEVVEALHGFDVLLTPTASSPAPRDLSTTGNPWFQSPWTLCGFPSISIPSGLSRAGLPLGIQLVSSPFDENGLLAAAHWCEKTLDVKLEPAL